MLPFIPAIVPSIIQALVIATAFVLIAAPVLRKYGFQFYAGFIIATLLTFVVNSDNLPAANVVVQLCASCYTGVAFYLLVMFAGALPRTWWFTKRLLSVRSEMSIIGGWIILGHVVKVAMMVPLSFTSFWTLIWKNGSFIMWIACGVVGPLLLVCFLLPWITSFKIVRRRIKATTWKKVQKLAYPFMALMVLQGILLGFGHAAYAGVDAVNYVDYLATSIAYIIIGVAYLASKITLEVTTRRRRKQRLAKQGKNQD